jgi:palmitoyltransferase ZDHHC2/15/20
MQHRNVTIVRWSFNTPTFHDHRLVINSLAVVVGVDPSLLLTILAKSSSALRCLASPCIPAFGLVLSTPTIWPFQHTTMKRRSCAQLCERVICNTVIYLPLVVVCGATTWAEWVLVNLNLLPEQHFSKEQSRVPDDANPAGIEAFSLLFGTAFYVLLNWSYLTAVFTPPGSPHTSASDMLDTDVSASSVTVKSNGQLRYCKKCQCYKPDRTHHCSTCRACVLKMDHHCPWLATCVGFRNYKPFVLFCVYTSLFAWVCFFTSVGWMLQEVFGTGGQIGHIGERTEAMIIHFVILSVISGIIGLVISGFASYHIYLTVRNRTTLESLEKTRYLSPLKTMVTRRLEEGGRGSNMNDEGEHRYHNGNLLERSSISEQLREMGTTLTEIHANALPGVLRAEEGEEEDVEMGGRAHESPAASSLRRYLHETGIETEERQYSQYLDDRDNEQLPNAFDLGWKRNIVSVLGPNPWTWFLPVCNSQGDGWNWEKSEKWMRARDEMRWQREREYGDRRAADGEPQWATQSRPTGDGYSGDAEESSDDEADVNVRQQQRLLRNNGPVAPPGQSNWRSGAVESWNDIPDDMITSGRRR